MSLALSVSCILMFDSYSCIHFFLYKRDLLCVLDFYGLLLSQFFSFPSQLPQFFNLIFFFFVSHFIGGEKGSDYSKCFCCHKGVGRA